MTFANTRKITGGKLIFKIKDNKLKITLEFNLVNRCINELVITFKDAKNEFLECLREDIYSSFWGIDLIVNTEKLSKKEREIFYHIINLKGILSKDFSKNRVVISTPVDSYFLEKMFQFKVFLKFENIEKRLSLKKETYSLKFFLSDNYQRLTVENIENIILLPANPNSYIIEMERGKVYPLKNIFSHNVIMEIFEDGSFYTDEEIKKKLLFTEKELGKYINLPEILKVSNGEILFDINMPEENRFELFCYVKNENLRLKINFEEIRQKSVFQEDIIIEFEKNKIALIESGSELYSKLKMVNSVLQASFFRLLDEIRREKIVSSDLKALFGKALPELDNIVSLEINGKKASLYMGKIDGLSVNAKESESPDWLEVDFKIIFGNYELTLEELKTLIERGFVKKGNTVISISENELNEMRSFLSRINILKKDDTNYVRREFIPLLFDIKEGISVKLPEKFSKFREELYNVKKGIFTGISLTLPERLKNIIRDYQKVGIYWLYLLYQYGFGGILADEMGLGKSLQILTLLYTLKEKIIPSLIICPSALVNNWANEIRKFFDKEFNFVIIDGNKEKRRKILSEARNYEILITSYNLLIQDEKNYENIEFAFCILDEAQHIKNKDAKRTKSVKKIKARMKIALTGTPLENYPLELWSIFDFILPEYLGNHRWFKKNIENPILKEGYKNKKEILNVFKGLVFPYILRRTKDKVLKELPPKIEQDIELELTEKQKIIYLEILNATKEKLFKIFEDKGFEKSYIDFLAALTRLRQICIHPGLINNEFFDEEDISIKLQALMELIYELIDSNRKVVIYSQFVEFLKFLKLRLYSENFGYLYLDGRTKDRPALVEYFNTSEEKILLASIKAGGVGLNITGADSVIIVDPWWNPTVEAQAIDRLHRIGQKNVVFAYRLLTKGTVEEKIKHLQNKKKRVASEIVDIPEEFYKTLNLKQIEELFSY